MNAHPTTTTAPLWLAGITGLAGPLLAAGLLLRGRKRAERRDRTVGLAASFLDEPMASTRRAAWYFLQSEGSEVRHFSAYLTDERYGDPGNEQGVVALLKVILFHRTVQDLRGADALDEQLYQVLLEPHRRAWSQYTTTIADQSGSDPQARSRGDAALFSWRASG